MSNHFKYTLDNKRYHTFNYYLKTRFKKKASKISLDASFSCPNRDGKISTKGCIFCSKEGSGDFTNRQVKNLLDQYNLTKLMMEKKWPNALTIPYFQAFTNTYGPLSKIKSMLEPFMNMDEVCAVALATRADCLDDEKIAYLDSLTSKKEVWVELGLQSTNNNTADLINRGHSFETFVDCLNRLKNTNIKVCIHIINGLPYETEKDMIQTVIDLSPYNFHAIKIHMLYVIKETKLHELYLNKPFHVLSKDEYIDITIKQLEHIRPEIVIQRITGDPVKENLIEPSWLLNKTMLINDIDKEMVKRDTYQGLNVL